MAAIRVAVPVHNAVEWVDRCLDSLVSQDHDFLCMIADDASTDGTADKILAHRSMQDARFTYVRNTQNLGSLMNAMMAFKRLGTRYEPDAILVTVDGDDWLYHPGALRYVASVYDADTRLLLTYGNHIDHPGGEVASWVKPYPADVVDRRSFRQYPDFLASHLRTCRSRLWWAIGTDYILDPHTGEPFRVCGDFAAMVAMLEMAGDRHRYLNDVLYVYNRSNPQSDCKIHKEEISRIVRYVRSLPPCGYLTP